MLPTFNAGLFLLWK